MSFGDHVQRAIMQALKAIPAADAPGIYAVSFFIYDEDDEPQQPALTVGYNTESQVKHVRDNVKDSSTTNRSPSRPKPPTRPASPIASLPGSAIRRHSDSCDIWVRQSGPATRTTPSPPSCGRSSTHAYRSDQVYRIGAYMHSAN